MTVAELYRVLDKKIPSSLRCEWDRDGLMCAPHPDTPVKKILFTLDVSEAAVNDAIQRKADLIISHHPLLFRPVGELHPDSFTGRKLISLVEHNIAVFSFHTRLDRMIGGVNDVLAERLGITETEPFGDSETPEIGRIGWVGETTLSDFTAHVQTVLGTPALQTLALGKPVRRVAVVGGDGKDFIPAAKKAGADLYLTGTLSYNSMVDAADMGLQLIEAGHFFTENPVIYRLGEWVQALLPEAELLYFNSNPVAVYR